MNKRGLQILEYNKIIEMLTSKASSQPGKAMCTSLIPSITLDEIILAQRQTADALMRLFSKGNVNFGHTKDFMFALKSLEIGSVLSMVELLHIANFLENVARVKQYSRNDKEETSDTLTDFFNTLEPVSPLSKSIRACILSENEVADDASSGLKHVRRQMQLVNDRIHTQLSSLLNGSMRTMLQETVITMRNNRYCLPVKSEYKNQVAGMVHDQSSSGSTFFIEPQSIVSLNNQLRELELKEQEEIDIILADLSNETSSYTLEISENQRLMTLLDFIFAKASLAMDMNASMPIFNNDHIIHIKGGRHPLLDKKKVVPIDIHLGRDFDLLIVTGPNTGGKTVSLKTVGLFTLMGQAGLHIPAKDRSELGLFTKVYADIGDEQSIEQSLSTFSSHMTNIVTILKYADSNSLCLFDELGAGTDPTEGAALAISILNHLHDRGIRTMATTHYSELKLYALSTSFVENASCEFDVASLQPTYRLLIGIPGKSNAFAISEKLGLPKKVIDGARRQITSEQESFEDVIADLEASRITLEKEKKEIELYKREIESLKNEIKSQQTKLADSKDKILREANEKARTILQEAKEVADETIRSMTKAKSNTLGDLEKEREKVRNKIKEKNNKLSIQQISQPVSKQLKPTDIKIGDSIKVLSTGFTGTVSTLPDKKGNLFITCGIMRSNVRLSDLALIKEAPTSTKSGSKYSNSGSGSSGIKMSKSFNISPEINLLGLLSDEAIAKLDKYIDDAYLSHLQSIRIVHGKGTGALRNAVHAHLKRLSVIKSFRLGEYGEGDAGVTIAEFK